MTREELEEWSNDWKNEKLSSGAFILYLKLYISDFESHTCESCKLHDSMDCPLDVASYLFDDNFGCNKWEAKDAK